MEAEKTAAPAHRVEQLEEEVYDDASSIRSAARGDDLPKGYFYSIGFLGAVTVSIRDLCLGKNKYELTRYLHVGFQLVNYIGLHLLAPAYQRFNLHQRRYR